MSEYYERRIFSMYDVYFSYFDGNEYLCKDVVKIEIPSSSGAIVYSGEEIATHRFAIYSEFYLYSKNTSYTISSKGLKAIEIRKKA